MHQINKTITTLEIAEMMEMKHYQVLEKLEGTKKSKGIIEILGDHEIMVSKYFIESSYKDTSGKENKCYLVTKLGCDFLANKFTGEKGILFTVKYVERFNDMEHQINQLPLTERPGEVANLINVLSRIMKNQGTAPYKIAENTKFICDQFGIRLPDDFVRIPEYEQMQLSFSR